MNVNDAPVITGEPVTEIKQGDTYSFNVVATDLDGDELTYLIDNRPTWLSFDENSGELQGTADNEAVGIYSDIRIGVSDGVTASYLEPFYLLVENVNDTPTIIGDPMLELYQGERYVFKPEGNDIDGDVLTYEINVDYEWLSFDPVTGELVGTPSASDIGVYKDIEISLTDGESVTRLDSFDIAELKVNDAPVRTGASFTLSTAISKESNRVTDSPSVNEISISL
jgi:hypothetical protein